MSQYHSVTVSEYYSVTLSTCHSVIIIHFRAHLGREVLIVVLSLAEEDIRQRVLVRHKYQEGVIELLLVCMLY